MRKVTDIYKEYKIMPFLQNHMIRVAAVASIICDNLDVKVNKENIILACLFHDMGNIIKSSLTVFPETNEPEGIEYWQKVKDDFIKTYGNHEHEAAIKIAGELGLPERAIELIDKVNFSLVCQHRSGTDMDMKVVSYSDNRVGPYGVMSYDDRMEESGNRYRNMNDSLREEERKRLVACGKDIEAQIFAKCKIKPEDINDEAVKPIISELRNFVIK